MAGRRPVAFFLALLATATAFQPPKTLSVRCAGNEPREITRTPSGRSRNTVASMAWGVTRSIVRASALQSGCPHRPRAPVASEAGKPTGEKEKMSAWETYTDGEYGQAFKFPWEVEASDKTAIGHVIPGA
jgi:hypothetical protein